MAGSLNKILLIGRLGRDPEVRSTSTGQDVANFTVATDESYTANNGEKIDKTEWHKIVAWGKQAEFAANFLHKGSLVYIEGKIEYRKWKDQSGIDKYTTEIIAARINGLDSKIINQDEQKITTDHEKTDSEIAISVIDKAPF